MQRQAKPRRPGTVADAAIRTRNPARLNVLFNCRIPDRPWRSVRDDWTGFFNLLKQARSGEAAR